MTIDPLRPRLSLACELDAARLQTLFADPSVIEDLQALDARVTMMLSDYSDERASVVQRLNAAGTRVVAVPLLPADQGYYFTPENVAEAEASYAGFTQWTAAHGLVWDGIGLDIEPEARIYQSIMDGNPRELLSILAPRLRDAERPVRARIDYARLVDRIHADGWTVENYQFPLIAEERGAGSTVLQRVMGIVDLPTDREVWMLYTSFARGLGPSVLWAYGPDATAIAVGTTGGGPDIPGQPQMPSLGWDELERDLRLAAHWSDDLTIHSLEGCVWQGFLPRIRSFDWSVPATPPDNAWVGTAMRRALQATLWAGAHPWTVVGAVVTARWLLRRGRRGS